MAETIYDITVKDAHGVSLPPLPFHCAGSNLQEDVQLRDYEGKVLLIVNVASNCGRTDENYRKLPEIHQKYREKGTHLLVVVLYVAQAAGFEVLAFPCSQFLNQEPGTNEEIW